MPIRESLRRWSLMLIVVAAALLSVAESLQCYTCRGIPFYDPDSCFSPYRGRTVRQECNRGEVCETRLHRSESFDKIIERGCTNACGSRTYVWTDYFQVHCCNQNECNASSTIHYNYAAIILSVTSVIVTWKHILHR